MLKPYYENVTDKKDEGGYDAMGVNPKFGSWVLRWNLNLPQVEVSPVNLDFAVYRLALSPYSVVYLQQL